MKNIKAHIKYVLRLIWATWPLILIALLVWYYVYVDSCMDIGQGVWDSKHFTCRNDCLKWTWKDGCIPLED